MAPSLATELMAAGEKKRETTREWMNEQQETVSRTIMISLKAE